VVSFVAHDPRRKEQGVLISEILFKAADLQQQHGLHKGQYYDSETGKLCGHGAIYKAMGYYENNERFRSREELDAFHRACTALDKQAPLMVAIAPGFPEKGRRLARTAQEKNEGTRWFPWYNDRPQTTLRKVVECMRRAAKAEAAKGN
jgi:hypothetical protein